MSGILDFAPVPRPLPGQLTIYLLGPGYGESQVIALPDGRWAVVDACLDGDRCLPLDLLKHLGATQIDLLVVTHPDLDHIAGLPELLDSFPIGRAWRYPATAHIHDLLARWCRGRDVENRLKTLHDVIQRLDLLADQNSAVTAQYGFRSWPESTSPEYQLHCIAPVPRDILRVTRALVEVVDSIEGRPALAAKVVKYLLGDRVRWRPGPNALSLGVVIEWSGTRLLLAGDIENGDGDPHSGWPGIMRILDEDSRAHLLQDLALVKVAHHGSRGAYHDPAWSTHADSSRVALAVMTPFDRGSEHQRPPHRETLRGIRKHTQKLGITAVKSWHMNQVTATGWVASRGGPAGPPCIAVAIRQGALPEVHCTGPARLFQQPEIA